jgi:hypothetical protein
MFALSNAENIYFLDTFFYKYRIRQEGKNMTSCNAMMRRNHEFAKMMEAVAGLDYSNPKTKRHLV